MQIIKENPPFYNRILEAGMNPTPKALYAYGDKIYNPSGIDIPKDILVHEETHSRQQGDKPDLWWDRFLSDIYFRMSEEVEAYATQYNYLCTLYKDRNQRFQILWKFSTLLSSPTYGEVISATSACAMIKAKALELQNGHKRTVSKT